MGERLVRDFILGFVRIHALHHAALRPVCGVELLAELGDHGYVLSPGTLYPLLQGLERAGYLVREHRVVAGRVRKYYGISARGQEALRTAQERVAELTGELLGGRATGR